MSSSHVLEDLGKSRLSRIALRRARDSLRGVCKGSKEDASDVMLHASDISRESTNQQHSFTKVWSKRKNSYQVIDRHHRDFLRLRHSSAFGQFY